MTGTGGRDLRPHVAQNGGIAVRVEIGGWSGRRVGIVGDPTRVAAWLRDLADDVEAAGKPTNLRRPERP